MKRRIVLASSLALLLVFLARWQFPDDRGARIVPSLPDTRFDYALSDFSARFVDADGRVELMVSGPRLEHDSSLRVATVFEPRFRIEPDDANWQGQAERALLQRDKDETILEGDVRVSQSTPTGEIRVLSERLQYHSLARTIRSSTPVEIHYPGALIQAGAMLLRLNDDFLEFSDHVQGELHPGRSDPGS